MLYENSHQLGLPIIKKLYSLFLILVFLILPCKSYGDDLDYWNWRSPDYPVADYNGVATNGTAFVAVGERGTMVHSTDGISWTQVSTGLSWQSAINDITYGNSKFVAVASGSTVLTSTDGVTWALRSSINATAINYVNSMFVAVGAGFISKSVDGINWSTTSVSDTFYNVSYGNGIYVAVGLFDAIWTSTDATNWTEQTSDNPTKRWYGVTYGNGVFVIVGGENPSTSMILTSVDGVTWSTQTIPNFDILRDVIYDGSNFIATGWQQRIYSSTDGYSWTSVNRFGSNIGLNGNAYSGSTFVSVGDKGTIYSSTDVVDGATWTSRTQASSRNYEVVAHDGTQFVAAGYPNRVATSVDGKTWNHTTGTGLTDTSYDMVYANSMFVIAANGGRIFTSTNGINWTLRASGTTSLLEDITYDNSMFVAVGMNGTIVTSSDGINWTVQTSGVSAHLEGVSYGNSAFVAVGYSGVVLTSPNGVTWTEQVSGIAINLYDVTYGNGLFVASASNRRMFTSPDGVTWTQRSLPGSVGMVTAIEPVLFSGSTFLVSDIFGYVSTSEDGITWAHRYSTGVSGLRNATSGNNSFVLVGNSGMIIQSGDEFAPVTTPSHSSGMFEDNFDVTLLCDDTVIGVGCSATYYTLDGSEPDTGSTVYSTAITISADTTLKYFSVDNNGNSETPDTRIYTLTNNPPVPTASDIYCDMNYSCNTQVYHNDVDSGDSHSYSVTTLASFGSASVDGSGYVTYTPDADYTGSDYFVVTVTDSGGLSGTVGINVSVEGVSLPAGDTGTPGIGRNDGGSDGDNLDTFSGNPVVDMEFVFSVVFKDSSGNVPQSAMLYLTNRTSPNLSDYFTYDLICTGDYSVGAQCSYSTVLPPSAVNNFHFEIVRNDGTLFRYPSAGDTTGPQVEMLNNYAMLSVARDIDSAILDSSGGFDCTTAYRWVSNGLSKKSGNKGAYELVDSDNPLKAGEAYFVEKASCGAGYVPELPIYSNLAAPSHEIILEPGWNIISNPYGGRVMLKDIRVQKGADPAVTWAEAVDVPNEWVLNGIYYSNGVDWGSTYTLNSSGGAPDAELVPWLGYWIYLKKDDDTYKLIFTKP